MVGIIEKKKSDGKRRKGSERVRGQEGIHAVHKVQFHNFCLVKSEQ